MTLTDAEFEREYKVASQRGEARLRNQPLAISARYDRRSRKIIVELNNGCSMLIPPSLLQGLTDASNAELSDVKVLSPGTTVTWPKLDVHHSIDGLMAGRVGTARWMKQLAAGNVTARKASALRHPTPVHRSKKRTVKHART